METQMDLINNFVVKWQDVLRLRDWDIRVKIVENDWRKSGDVKIDVDDKKAVLLINKNPKSTNIEELVIHELLHIKLWGMDQMIEHFIKSVFGDDENDVKRNFAMYQFLSLLEITVEDLTKGYLAVSDCKEALSFGRLESKIIEEIGVGL